MRSRRQSCIRAGRGQVLGSQQLYLTLRPKIDEAIRRVCSRHRLVQVDAQDFSGTVHLHIIKDDYAVLRNFREQSSIETYLHTVVGNQFQDWRNAKWGKYRPSPGARRRGPIAVHLERLIVRDGLTFEQAYETLRTNFSDVLAEHAATARPDEPIMRREAAESAQAASRVLARAVSNLSTEDQLIARMRFGDGFQVAQIARALHLDQRQLYRRIDRFLAELRGHLGRAGITPKAAAEVLADGGFGSLDEEGEGTSELGGTVRPFSGGPRSAANNKRTGS